MERTIVKLLLALLILLAAAPAEADMLYYSVEEAGEFTHLYGMDLGTELVEDLGILHGRRYTTDLAVSPDGDLFGVGWKNASAHGSAKLYRIIPGDEDTPAQWSLEKIKSNKMERTVNAATFDRAGNLYVASRSGKLQKLVHDDRKDRWQVVKTGRIGAPCGGDLAFAPDGSTLYIALAGGVLATLNFDADSDDFGQASVIGCTGYEEIFGLGFVDGQLYGTTNGPGNYGFSSLIQIDPLTAEAAELADLGRGVWGAAAAPLQVVPEPLALSLVVTGFAALVLRGRGGSRRFR